MGLIGHPGKAVRHAGDAALKQAKHAAHAVNFIERRHKMHFRGAGIGNTILHATICQGIDKRRRAIHGVRAGILYIAHTAVLHAWLVWVQVLPELFRISLRAAIIAAALLNTSQGFLNGYR